MLLKIGKESKYKVEAEESSRFVFNLGLSELHCCLLMNGLVHESNEVSNCVFLHAFFGNMHTELDCIFACNFHLLSFNAIIFLKSKLPELGKIVLKQKDTCELSITL